MGDKLMAIAHELKGSLDKLLDATKGGLVAAVRGAFSSKGQSLSFEQIMTVFSSVWNKVLAKVESMGDEIATKMVDVFSDSGVITEVIGKICYWVGYAVGTVVFQVILDVLTAGGYTFIGPTVMAIAKFINFPAKLMGPLFELLGKFGKLVPDFMKRIAASFGGGAGGFLESVLGPLNRFAETLVKDADPLAGMWVKGAAADGASAAQRNLVRLATRSGIVGTGEKASVAGPASLLRRVMMASRRSTAEGGAEVATKEVAEGGAAQTGAHVSPVGEQSAVERVGTDKAAVPGEGAGAGEGATRTATQGEGATTAATDSGAKPAVETPPAAAEVAPRVPADAKLWTTAEDGRPIYKLADDPPHFVDSAGRMTDDEGLLVDPHNPRRGDYWNYINEHGEPVDSAGRLLSDKAEAPTTPSVSSGGSMVENPVEIKAAFERQFGERIAQGDKIYAYRGLRLRKDAVLRGTDAGYHGFGQMAILPTNGDAAALQGALEYAIQAPGLAQKLSDDVIVLVRFEVKPEMIAYDAYGQMDHVFISKDVDILTIEDVRVARRPVGTLTSEEEKSALRGEITGGDHVAPTAAAELAAADLPPGKDFVRMRLNSKDPMGGDLLATSKPIPRRPDHAMVTSMGSAIGIYAEHFDGLVEFRTIDQALYAHAELVAGSESQVRLASGQIANRYVLGDGTFFYSIDTAEGRVFFGDFVSGYVHDSQAGSRAGAAAVSGEVGHAAEATHAAEGSALGAHAVAAPGPTLDQASPLVTQVHLDHFEKLMAEAKEGGYVYERIFPSDVVIGEDGTVTILTKKVPLSELRAQGGEQAVEDALYKQDMYDRNIDGIARNDMRSRLPGGTRPHTPERASTFGGAGSDSRVLTEAPVAGSTVVPEGIALDKSPPITRAHVDNFWKRISEANQEGYVYESIMPKDVFIGSDGAVTITSKRTSLAAIRQRGGPEAVQDALDNQEAYATAIGKIDLESAVGAVRSSTVERETAEAHARIGSPEMQARYAEPADMKASADKVRADMKATIARNASGEVTNFYDKLMADPLLSPEAKERVISAMTRVTDHYAEVGKAGTAAYQEINRLHTLGEIDRVLDACRTMKHNETETEEAIIATIFYDSHKMPGAAIMLKHNQDGADSAAVYLERELGSSPDAMERIARIRTYVKEHQIGPPVFFSNMFENALRAVRAPAVDFAKAKVYVFAEDEVEALAGIKRKIADPLNPANHNAAGDALAFTDAEQESCSRRSASTSGRSRATKLRSRSSPATSSINYASPEGAAKMVSIRGPGTPFPDATAQDSVASVLGPKGTGPDARTVLHPDVVATFDQHAVATKAAVERALEKRVDEWLIAQGRDPAHTPVLAPHCRSTTRRRTEADQAFAKEAPRALRPGAARRAVDLHPRRAARRRPAARP